jgi:hypothetical protein
VIPWSLSRYLRCDDGHPSPSSHRKWMSYGLKSTHSLQSKILLVAAIPEGSEGAGEDREQSTISGTPARSTLLNRPVFNLRPQPELDAAPAEVDYRSRHVLVSVLVDADRVRV